MNEDEQKKMEHDKKMEELKNLTGQLPGDPIQNYHVCPHCGYCPLCGRPYYPIYPSYSPYPNYPYPWNKVWC